MYYYRIYGDQHAWAWVDFIEEIKTVYGKSIEDYRTGHNIINSVDIEIDRPISVELLNKYNFIARLISGPKGNLIPIQYRGLRYPGDIQPRIKEVAGHFDISSIRPNKEYSLHTEYSFGERNFNSSLIKRFPNIYKSNKNGIPQLWHSQEWAKEFAEFILALICEQNAPAIIEIHPPFSDYSNIQNFFECYNAFEERMQQEHAHIIYLIENRRGTKYESGKFILSRIEDMEKFSEQIDCQNINLKLTLDIPQLFAAHAISKNSSDDMNELFKRIESIRHNIQGIHLWGRKTNEFKKREAHIGNLDTYFKNNMEIKMMFLNKLYEVFSDKQSRYFVPEVNSNSNDLACIINDLQGVGFTFTG